METKAPEHEKLSPWWRNAVILIMIVGFSVLIGLTVRSYRDAPPIPEKVMGPAGEVVFTGEEVRAGQQVFLKYGLMENGSVWGHGAYLGPAFPAVYLHALGQSAAEKIAQDQYGQSYDTLDAAGQSMVQAEVASIFKQNH